MNITTIILLELLGKSAAVLPGALLCGFFMRRASAARRSLVWTTAFVALLVLPFTKLLSPRWGLPVRQPAAQITMKPESVAVPMENLQIIPAATAASVPSRLPDWRNVMLAVWMAGCVALLCHRLLGSAQLARLKRRSALCVDERVAALAQKIAGEFGVNRHVDIRLSREASVPMTWGAWKPVLMFPADIAEWGEGRLAAALRHEFGHIARRDCLMRLAAQFATAFYWPNPFAWLALRALQMAQEETCDDLVLRAGTPADEYAMLLLDAGRKWTAGGFLARHTIAMARPAALEGRVRAIMDDTRDRRPAQFPAKLAASLGLVLAFALCALAQVSATDGPTTLAPDNWPPAREGLISVTYDVPSKLITPINGGYRGPDGKVYTEPMELLEAIGVEFPVGASANLITKTIGKLVVRTNIDSQNIIGKFYNLPAIPHPAGNTKKFFEAILPNVSLKDATLGECADYFRKKSIELDTTEADPAKRGVNIVIKLPWNGNAVDDIANKKVTLDLANVSFREAFKKFVDQAGLRAYSEPYAIALVPLDEPGNPQAKTIDIPADGAMTLNGIPVRGSDDLEQKLRDAHAANPDLVVIIAAGRDVPIDQIKDVVDMLKKLAIKQAGVETRPAQAPESKNRVNIKSDTTSFEEGIAMAKGHAELQSDTLAIKADAIKYDSATQSLEATGHVSFERHDGHSETTSSGGKISYNLMTQKLDSDGQIATASK